MQIVSIGDNLHEMSKPVFWEKQENISKCRLLKILPRILSVKSPNQTDNWAAPRGKVTLEQLRTAKKTFAVRLQNYWIV